MVHNCARSQPASTAAGTAPAIPAVTATTCASREIIRRTCRGVAATAHRSSGRHPGALLHLERERAGDHEQRHQQRGPAELMAQGHTNATVAELLFVTERAVSKHIGSIFTKLGLPPTDPGHRRVLAVLTWLDDR
jgi:DNA-binding NarL/FixJ family response regulator